ncbi:hypothetical protein Tco_0814453, partial [Tanacetum coccineum]
MIANHRLRFDDRHKQMSLRGITIESSLCPVCSVCEEDVCHIFFRCDLAQLVLRRICRWWGLDPHDWSSFQEWQSWSLSIQFSSK